MRQVLNQMCPEAGKQDVYILCFCFLFFFYMNVMLQRKNHEVLGLAVQ